MDAIEKHCYEVEAQHLRLELKKWETTWARDHDGAKPSRDDIKRTGEIAHKYTSYNRLRNILSGKMRPKKESNSESRRDDSRRKRTADTTLHTPSKRLRALQTPMKENIHPDEAADAVTPSISRRLFSPVVPTSIGPTPQRDGRVLGLFDILSDEDDDEKRRRMAMTPSKSSGVVDATTITTTSSGKVLFAATPRKQTLGAADDDDQETDKWRLGRTPMSSAKRNLLDRFTTVTTSTTALRTRDDNNQQSTQASRQSHLTTPSKGGMTPQPFATPAFLRRAPAPLSVDENGEFLSPPGRLRLPRKPLVRGLSSVLASLRKMEDERLDEELEALRDLEADEETGGGGDPQRPQRSPPAHPGPRHPNHDRHEQVQVQDSQVPQAAPPIGPPQSPSPAEPRVPRLLGGFDDEGLYDSPPEDAALGRDGQPLRVFKKKGQKRTTRLVHMRPTRTKRPAAGTMAEEDASGDDSDDAAVPETQTAAVDIDGSDYGSDYGSDDEAKAKTAAKKTKTKKSAVAKDGTAGRVKQAARKVNELAHANFKRLKLRSKGSKGGPGFNSRFRRRR